MDLNNPPPGFDYDFLDAIFEGPTDAADPIFCTQQPPNQQDVPTVSKIRLSLQKTRIEDVPGASIGDEQIVAGNVVVDCIFLGNLSVIY